MRTPRIVILVFFLSASIFLSIRALTTPTPRYAPSSSSSSSNPSSHPIETRPSRSVWGLIFYNTPFSLFPPNAAISLTDDNSTSFAARPAAFGPKLESDGLSGQLWVGSGFVDDGLDGHGELGCSDLPGWEGGNTGRVLKQSLQTAASGIDVSNDRSDYPKRRREPLLNGDERDANAKTRSSSDAAVVDDGTDNHLHAGLGSSLTRRDAATSPPHADIQSIQEGAEIEGKIVLLMRGGCGFLEKVMWAQRRGAIAVIVGDNVKGGPLIQMFAHGDEVDNVTVPSVFTARTTAQLLSSLTQPGSFIEDTLDDNGNPVLKVQQGPKTSRNKKQQDVTATKASSKMSRASKKPRRLVKKKEIEAKPSGWFSRLFSWGTSLRTVDNESRPPSSGRLDWVLVEDWNDEKDGAIRSGMTKTKKPSEKTKTNGDNFIIGVQDWRDPDLAAKGVSGTHKEKTADKDVEQKATSTSSKNHGLGKSSSKADEPKGGSITPGSGEYKPYEAPKDGKDTASGFGSREGQFLSERYGLLSKLFGDKKRDDGLKKMETSSANVDGNEEDDGTDDPPADDDPEPQPHEGLWVTITPTSGASPLFDTLLVLVISPLVTLTIVYALLILRARIRRRRWRAPKSVVERLPVRTYHTVARSPSMSPRLPSPSSTSPTTPLLQQSPSPPRSRPRSRTTTGVPESENFLTGSSSVQTPRNVSRTGGRPEHEKKGSEWRKHMGRQVECVVCLEEYVDGVSRVMRLPCGHEFHADCITPWLTTRRRTCPICKGDVVRSMARGSWISPREEPYRDDGDDEPEAEGSGSRSANGDSDLEQGGADSAGPSETRGQTWQDGWLGMLSNGIGGRRSRPRSRSRSRSPSLEDRSR